MTKDKYYVVWKGLIPGIYNTWQECAEQIKGFTGAVYKSFKSRELAEEAFKDDYKKYFNKESAETKSGDKKPKFAGSPVLESLSVDAACSGNPGLMEYRGVYTKTRKEIFRKGPFRQGTNNIGEFLAVVHGLAYLKKRKSSIPVYSDSVSAMSWVRKKKIKTMLEETDENKELFNLLERALKWLNENEYSSPVLKWETEVWGEIPADFGRK